METFCMKRTEFFEKVKGQQLNFTTMIILGTPQFNIPSFFIDSEVKRCEFFKMETKEGTEYYMQIPPLDKKEMKLDSMEWNEAETELVFTDSSTGGSFTIPLDKEIELLVRKI